MNSVESLRSLAEELAASAPPPDSPQAQYVAAVHRWLDGEARSLDEAFGVAARRGGDDRAITRYRRAQRDLHLAEAWAQLAGGPTQRAKTLAAEVARFESCIWPRWRNLEAPPPGCSALRRALWQARRCGELPRSQRQLRNIGQANSGPIDFRPPLTS